MVSNWIDLNDVKIFFDIKEDSLDELLTYLIEHYSEVIIDKTGVRESNVKTKEALLLAIGCHLQKTNLEEVSSVISYTVKNTKERFQSPSVSEATWCDLYQEAINEILAEESNRVVVIGRKRPGISDQYGF